MDIHVSASKNRFLHLIHTHLPILMKSIPFKMKNNIITYNTK